MKQRIRLKRNKSNVIRELCGAMHELDKLQVELCSETPYETPSTEEVRERVRDVMDMLDEIYCMFDSRYAMSVQKLKRKALKDETSIQK